MIIKKGDTGIKVQYVQYGLHILCFPCNTFNGVFADSTEVAVRQYQQKYGLSVTGQVNDLTWNSIIGEITTIQRALQKKGLPIGVANGLATASTLNAVKSFQSSCGLLADGKVGPLTRVKLMSDTSLEVTNSDFPMSQGATGSKVKYVQYALHILAYYPGAIDGNFGTDTYNAVIRFQNANSLSADGIVGEITWNKLSSLIRPIQTALKNNGYNIVVDGVAGSGTYSSVVNFQEKNGLSEDGIVGPATCAALGLSNGFPLSQGSSGQSVKYLQYGLYICCYNPNGIDGAFGGGTAAAVQLFQAANNLTANGIVDVSTWEALRGKIMPIQKALTNRGYATGGTDGVAREETYAAVRQYQADSGLVVDGMVGNATLSALGITNGTSYGTVSATLSIGSTGSLTRYLQKMLATLGYTTVPVDGVFNSSTKTVVQAFQTSKGLSADGVVGPATWNALFRSYSVPVGGTGAQKLVNVAIHEYNWGFREENDNNISPYGIWYGMNGEPWCAMFVSWCAKYAGILAGESATPKVPMYAYCPYGVEWYRNRNKFFERNSSYKIRLGDIIFIWNTESGEVGHTGIVVGGTEDTITTIEGNASNMIIRRTYNKMDVAIYGYGCNDGAVLPFRQVNLPADAVDTAIRNKFFDLLERLSCDTTALSFLFNTEFTILNTPNIVVTAKVSKSTSLYDNSSGAVAYDITASGDVFSSAFMSSFSTKLGEIEINYGGFNGLPNFSSGKDSFLGAFLAIGYGKMKVEFSPSFTNHFGSISVSLIVCDSITLEDDTTHEYSFKLTVTLYNDPQVLAVAGLNIPDCIDLFDVWFGDATSSDDLVIIDANVCVLPILLNLLPKRIDFETDGDYYIACATVVLLFIACLGAPYVAA